MMVSTFELEKLMLKRDAEILNYCMRFDENGKVNIVENPSKFMVKQRKDGRSSSSSSLVS
jgi:hypothetical protein